MKSRIGRDCSDCRFSPDTDSLMTLVLVELVVVLVEVLILADDLDATLGSAIERLLTTTLTRG